MFLKFYYFVCCFVVLDINIGIDFDTIPIFSLVHEKKYHCRRKHKDHFVYM